MKEKDFTKLLTQSGYVTKEQFEQFDLAQTKIYIDAKDELICSHCALIGGPLCDSEYCQALKNFLNVKESDIPSTWAMHEPPGSDVFKKYSDFERRAAEFKFHFRSGSDTSIHQEQRERRDMLAIVIDELTPREKILSISAVSTITPIETVKETLATVYGVSVRRIEQEFNAIEEKVQKAAKDKKYASYKAEEMKIKG